MKAAEKVWLETPADLIAGDTLASMGVIWAKTDRPEIPFVVAEVRPRGRVRLERHPFVRFLVHSEDGRVRCMADAGVLVVVDSQPEA